MIWRNDTADEEKVLAVIEVNGAFFSQTGVVVSGGSGR